MPFYKSILATVLGLSVLASVMRTDIAASLHLNTATYVTRSEAAAFVLKHRDPPIPPLLNDGKYPDVAESEWYTKYVIAAVELDMWDPDIDTNRARPHKPITREELLKIFAIAFDLKSNQVHNYVDVGIGDWVQPYAGIAATYKLFLDPLDPLRLRPDIPVTHREASRAYYTLLRERPDLRPAQKLMIRKVVYKDTGGSRALADKADRNLLESSRTMVSRSALQDSLHLQKTHEQSTAERVQLEVLSAINEIRVNNNLKPLKLNKQLSTAAFGHAKDMWERKYFDHFSPEGGTYIDRIKASGYTDVDPIQCGCDQIRESQADTSRLTTGGNGFVVYASNTCDCRASYALGENLATGQLTVPEVVQDWMNSPGHKANILQPAFEETGIGIFRDLWAQKFGSFDALY
ncbi:MAG: CAP domain-containing protein [bacterium]|nr:CAP domain-containing protein [bacterium]